MSQFDDSALSLLERANVKEQAGESRVEVSPDGVFPTIETTMKLFSEELYGSKLECDDESIGKLTDFMVDWRNWSVSHVVCESGGLIGIGERTIPIDRLDQFLTGTDSIHFRIACGRDQSPGSEGLSDGRAANGDRTGTRGMRGCKVIASDGRAGIVTGFMIDLGGWKITEIVVRMGPWHSARQVLIDPELVNFVGQPRSEMKVDLTREELLGSWMIAEDKGLL